MEIWSHDRNTAVLSGIIKGRRAERLCHGRVEQAEQHAQDAWWQMLATSATRTSRRDTHKQTIYRATDGPVDLGLRLEGVAPGPLVDEEHGQLRARHMERV